MPPLSTDVLYVRSRRAPSGRLDQDEEHHSDLSYSQSVSSIDSRRATGPTGGLLWSARSSRLAWSHLDAKKRVIFEERLAGKELVILSQAVSK